MRHGNDAGFHRVLELVVASLGPGFPPAIRLQEPDDFAAAHRVYVYTMTDFGNRVSGQIGFARREQCLRLLPVLQQSLENLVHHIPRLGEIEADFLGGNLPENDPDSADTETTEAFKRTM